MKYLQFKTLEWIAKNEDCWYKCGLKGGSCDYCNEGSQKGYCCRKDGQGGNGDCPTHATDSISAAHHVCVNRNKGKFSKILKSISLESYLEQLFSDFF